MRRIKAAAVLVAVLLGASLVGAPAAMADYHGVCTVSGDGFDALYLTSEGANLRYRGYVTCTGHAITITKLTITQAGGASSSIGPLSCTSKCDLSATIPAAAGQYTATMTFTVDALTPAPRKAEWVYAGAGNPVKTCPTGGFPAPFNLCV